MADKTKILIVAYTMARISKRQSDGERLSLTIISAVARVI